MKKVFKNKVYVETIVRQLGSNGTLLGHWLLVDAVMERLSGHPVRVAAHRAAELHGIPMQLAHSRLHGVLNYMEKVHSERYVELWNGKRPTPMELIERIAAEAQQ